jgi:hypothetical protein
MVGPVTSALRVAEALSAVLPQRTLAIFLGEGPYGRYLRRIRALYLTLREAMEQGLAGDIRLPEIGAGLSIPVFSSHPSPRIN